MYILSGGKTFIGVTSDELSIDTTTKESTTKADAGVKSKRVASHTYNFTVSGLLEVDNSTASILDNDEIIALALANTTVSIVYEREDGKNYSGTAIVAGYTESTPADPDEDSTYSLQLRCKALTIVA